MHTYIKKLQSKEEPVRKQILVASLAVCMAIVGSVWVYGMTDRTKARNIVVAETEQGPKPFALFAGSVSDAFKNITASVGSVSFSKAKVETTEKQVDLIVVDEPAQ